MCALCIRDDLQRVTLQVMCVSLVYVLLGQVQQMLTQLAPDNGAKDVELLVLRQQVCGPPRQIRLWGSQTRFGGLTCGFVQVRNPMAVTLSA
jgi:hypothetical protein